MKYLITLIQITLLCTVSSCWLVSPAGDAVESIGDGTGEAVEGVGNGVSNAVVGTGRAFKKGVMEW